MSEDHRLLSLKIIQTRSNLETEEKKMSQIAQGLDNILSLMEDWKSAEGQNDLKDAIEWIETLNIALSKKEAVGQLNDLSTSNSNPLPSSVNVLRMISNAIDVLTPFVCSQCRTGERITAKKQARRNGTINDRAARMPAIRITKQAAITKQR